MKKKIRRLAGKRIDLRPIRLTDVSNRYRSWVNDRETNRYTETRFRRHTPASLRRYVRETLKDRSIFFWAIVRKDLNTHIGNIKLGPVDWRHKRGDIGILIGDKNSWNQGFATESIRLLSEFAFARLLLHKLTAGAYETNGGSIRAFEKAGFFQEGRRAEHALYNNRYIDVVLLAKLNGK